MSTYIPVAKQTINRYTDGEACQMPGSLGFPALYRELVSSCHGINVHSPFSSTLLNTAWKQFSRKHQTTAYIVVAHAWYNQCKYGFQRIQLSACHTVILIFSLRLHKTLHITVQRCTFEYNPKGRVYKPPLSSGGIWKDRQGTYKIYDSISGDRVQ